MEKDQIFLEKQIGLRKKKILQTREIAKEILDNWKVEEKIPKFKKKLLKYGFNDKIEEMENRLGNYTEIVMKELNV